MPIPEDYPFTRYLAAKKSVDDRALNYHVRQSLVQALPLAAPEAPLLILEVGAGIGTMLERMLEQGLLTYATFTAIDAQAENIAEARERLPSWAGDRGFKVRETSQKGLLLEQEGHRVAIELEAIDLFDFLTRERGCRRWDLLIAHAFLDLVDIPATLPILFPILREGGLFYFTINFDGVTILEPVIDPHLDELIVSLYHQTMDERLVNGKISGGSRAGRRLFTCLKDAGAQILSAGGSDWVVFSGPAGYLGDEAWFLHFIIHTIHGALEKHPQMDAARLAAWAARRHAQVESGEIVCIIHQLDFVGRVSAGGYLSA